jgi:hypothetical protein
VEELDEGELAVAVEVVPVKELVEVVRPEVAAVIVQL